VGESEQDERDAGGEVGVDGGVTQIQIRFPRMKDEMRWDETKGPSSPSASTTQDSLTGRIPTIQTEIANSQ